MNCTSTFDSSLLVNTSYKEPRFWLCVSSASLVILFLNPKCSARSSRRAMFHRLITLRAHAHLAWIMITLVPHPPFHHLYRDPLLVSRNTTDPRLVQDNYKCIAVIPSKSVRSTKLEDLILHTKALISFEKCRFLQEKMKLKGDSLHWNVLHESERLSVLFACFS
ncbi:hypothetical protein V6N11_002965 [Hibiscus sabdariffa]|uniref:Uncharacterized protein n=1 Tax=Hibiscus sabdariffa TaxID=183260 RepID=A0ABR2SBT8_9ROSI